MKGSVISNTIGLVVCGGKSSRMGVDKSTLEYFGKQQRYHVYEMLLPFCENVFISCNRQQADTLEPDYSFVTDQPQFEHIGPMAAVLSAFTKFPNKNLLLIGCDYPFLTIDNLQQFSICCKNSKPIGFYNADAELYEPLLAFYPYYSFTGLKKMFELKQYSLQHFLINTGAEKHLPLDKRSMQSVDTEAEYNKAVNAINN